MLLRYEQLPQQLTALTRRLFPLPGGPCSKSPHGGLTPRCVYSSGCRRGNSTSWRTTGTTSSMPPTSQYRIGGRGTRNSIPEPADDDGSTSSSDDFSGALRLSSPAPNSRGATSSVSTSSRAASAAPTSTGASCATLPTGSGATARTRGARRSARAARRRARCAGASGW